ncbi:uncharacterized protein [Triticum aestivum]|uniref:uncharacterized protein isoform X4 n=1 Tax=Triticum aestivum TaxID=4565 RepID=UPI001D02B866|nr:uncharacterized protein LOC123082625 isoform X4 [Triticum aestivum]
MKVVGTRPQKVRKVTIQDSQDAVTYQFDDPPLVPPTAGLQITIHPAAASSSEHSVAQEAAHNTVAEECPAQAVPGQQTNPNNTSTSHTSTGIPPLVSPIVAGGNTSVGSKRSAATTCNRSNSHQYENDDDDFDPPPPRTALTRRTDPPVKRPKVAKAISSTAGHNGNQPSKPAPTIRCSPGFVLSAIDLLTEDQYANVKATPFGEILNLKADALESRNLPVFLMNKTDKDTLIINVGTQGGLKITPHAVHCVMGTPLGGRDPSVCSVTQKNELLRLKNELSVPVDQNITYKTLCDYIKLKRPDDLSTRCFILIIFNWLLFPSTRTYISGREAAWTADIANIGAIDWSKAVVDYMRDSVATWHSKKNNNGVLSISGCVLFLIIYYLDNLLSVNMLDASQTPRIAFYNTGKMQAILSEDKSKNKPDSESYGNLPLRSQEGTCCLDVNANATSASHAQPHAHSVLFISMLEQLRDCVDQLPQSKQAVAFAAIRRCDDSVAKLLADVSLEQRKVVSELRCIMLDPSTSSPSPPIQRDPKPISCAAAHLDNVADENPPGRSSAQLARERSIHDIPAATDNIEVDGTSIQSEADRSVQRNDGVDPSKNLPSSDGPLQGSLTQLLQGNIEASTTKSQQESLLTAFYGPYDKSENDCTNQPNKPHQTVEPHNTVDSMNNLPPPDKQHGSDSHSKTDCPTHAANCSDVDAQGITDPITFSQMCEGIEYDGTGCPSCDADARLINEVHLDDVGHEHEEEAEIAPTNTDAENLGVGVSDVFTGQKFVNEAQIDAEAADHTEQVSKDGHLSVDAPIITGQVPVNHDNDADRQITVHEPISHTEQCTTAEQFQLEDANTPESLVSFGQPTQEWEVSQQLRDANIHPDRTPHFDTREPSHKVCIRSGSEIIKLPHTGAEAQPTNLQQSASTAQQAAHTIQVSDASALQLSPRRSARFKKTDVSTEKHTLVRTAKNMEKDKTNVPSFVNPNQFGAPGNVLQCGQLPVIVKRIRKRPLKIISPFKLHPVKSTISLNHARKLRDIVINDLDLKKTGLLAYEPSKLYLTGMDLAKSFGDGASMLPSLMEYYIDILRHDEIKLRPTSAGYRMFLRWSLSFHLNVDARHETQSFNPTFIEALLKEDLADKDPQDVRMILWVSHQGSHFSVYCVNRVHRRIDVLDSVDWSTQQTTFEDFHKPWGPIAVARLNDAFLKVTEGKFDNFCKWPIARFPTPKQLANDCPFFCFKFLKFYDGEENQLRIKIDPEKFSDYRSEELAYMVFHELNLFRQLPPQIEVLRKAITKA